MTLTRDELVPLDDAECRRLLATASLGRLGFTDRALPAIAPVCYAVHDGSVLIRPRRGDSLASAVSGAVVALQVDSFRNEVADGWSITVVGPARMLRHADPVGDIDALGLFPADGAPNDYVVVQLALVRGWRVGTDRPMVHAPQMEGDRTIPT